MGGAQGEKGPMCEKKGKPNKKPLERGLPKERLMESFKRTDYSYANRSNQRPPNTLNP